MEQKITQEELWMYINGAIYDQNRINEITNIIDNDENVRLLMEEMIDLSDIIYDDIDMDTENVTSQENLCSEQKSSLKNWFTIKLQNLKNLKDNIKNLPNFVLVPLTPRGEEKSVKLKFQMSDKEYIQIDKIKTIPVFQKAMESETVKVSLEIINYKELENIEIIVKHKELGEIKRVDIFEKEVFIGKFVKGDYIIGFYNKDDDKSIGGFELDLSR